MGVVMVDSTTNNVLHQDQSTVKCLAHQVGCYKSHQNFTSEAGIQGDCFILDCNDNWHGGSNDVTFFANEFDEINNKETKKNLLNSTVLGILTRFSSGFRVWLDSHTVEGIH